MEVASSSKTSAKYFYFPKNLHANASAWTTKAASLLVTCRSPVLIEEGRKKSFLPPWTLGRIRFFSLNFETGRPASSVSQNRSQDLLERVWGRFYYFSFMFILTEFWKNHSKTQKNHKIENLIWLDSIWVDIRSEHIIWYTLVQIFCNIFRYILFCN